MAGKRISCVAAMSSKNRGIGIDGKLPWRLKSEMNHFTRITTDVKQEGKQNAVIMGRVSWECIPAKYCPLPGRLNVILSRTISDTPENTLVCANLEKALDVLSKPPYDQSIENLYVIGGQSVFKEAMSMPNIHRIYLTKVHLNVECDTFYPEFDEDDFTIVSDPDVPTEMQEEKGIQFQYFVYEKKNQVCE